MFGWLIEYLFNFLTLADAGVGRFEWQSNIVGGSKGGSEWNEIVILVIDYGWRSSLGKCVLVKKNENFGWTLHNGGLWIIFHCLIYKFFCQLNLSVLSLYHLKYYHIMFIIIVFWLGSDGPSGLLFFVLALLISMESPIFLPSFVFSSYSFLQVPMRQCFKKTLVHEFHPTNSLTEWYLLFPTVHLQVRNEFWAKK